MPELTGSRTHQNLAAAFARESEANQRYLWYAQQADIDGLPDVAAVFRSIADSETSHVQGILEFLAEVESAGTRPGGDTAGHLRRAIAAETHDHGDVYPSMALTAREEGFDEIADWFETLVRAERGHAERFQHHLDELT